MIPRPAPLERGVAVAPDGVRVAWSRYGTGAVPVLFVPTWNLVDASVVGHQVNALSGSATVVTFDPRGTGASDRPERGYDFPSHAADALAVMDASGLDRACVVTASRGINVAVLMAVDHSDRVLRIASIGSYMRLERRPEPPDPGALEALRSDWAGFVVPFMRAVFTEPGSADTIASLTDIALKTSPDVIVQQELELDWTRPARLLGRVSQPTLLIHGEADQPVPASHAWEIASAMPDARVAIVVGGGHRPDIRTPESVDPLLLGFIREHQR